MLAESWFTALNLAWMMLTTSIFIYLYAEKGINRLVLFICFVSYTTSFSFYFLLP
jgi:hypothetical protein